MKRKMLFGLFLAVMALALTGCKQPEEDHGTAPVINELFCTNKKPVIDTDTGIQNWPRLTTVSNSDHFAVVVDFYDPDFDVTELRISFDDFKTYDTLQITSQDYEYQASWWNEIYFNFTGTYTVKAYLVDKKGNKSQTITKTITITD